MLCAGGGVGTRHVVLREAYRLIPKTLVNRRVDFQLNHNHPYLPLSMSNQDFYNNQGPKVRLTPQRDERQLSLLRRNCFLRFFSVYRRTNTTAASNSNTGSNSTVVEAQAIIPLRAHLLATKAATIPTSLRRTMVEDIRSREDITPNPRRTLYTYSNSSPRRVAAALAEEPAWPAWLVPAYVAAQKTSAIAFSNSKIGLRFTPHFCTRSPRL
ncbi:hypothetical protein BDV93DRAFT_124363 [Ceratobasidium sp. AG-I]|nr:hypothetical protein BDV93DRAFT_124363 [Ceratobasidium sp. AG-I]